MVAMSKVPDNEFETIDMGDDQFQRIRLLQSSPYPGVVYQYGKVKFHEELDSLRVEFKYEVFANPNKINTESVDFNNYIGNLLMTNIEELLLFELHKKGKLSYDE